MILAFCSTTWGRNINPLGFQHIFLMLWLLMETCQFFGIKVKTFFCCSFFVYSMFLKDILPLSVALHLYIGVLLCSWNTDEYIQWMNESVSQWSSHLFQPFTSGSRANIAWNDSYTLLESTECMLSLCIPPHILLMAGHLPVAIYLCVSSLLHLYL